MKVAQCPSLRPPIGTGPDSPYTYVPNGAPKYVQEAGPYWNMARQYVLADHFFPTDFGPSFTAHQNLVASTVAISNKLSLVNYPGTLTRAGGISYSPGPWSCDSPPGTKTSTVNRNRVISAGTGPFPCFTQYRTVADTLDAAANTARARARNQAAAVRSSRSRNVITYSLRRNRRCALSGHSPARMVAWE